MSNVFWRAQTLSVNPNPPPEILLGLPSRAILEKIPTITVTLLILAMWDFSSTEDVMGCDPQLPSYKPNAFYTLGFSRAMA